MTDYEIISLLLNALLLFGVAFAGFQLRAGILERQHDHERSRREKAVELLCHFDSSLAKEASMARKLLDQFSESQTKKIAAQDAVRIDTELIPFVDGVLGAGWIKEPLDEGMVTLSAVGSSEVRWRAIQYLNLLETVLAAWRHNVADKEMVEEQLKYIYSSERGDGAMAKLRRAEGVDNFPSISLFIQGQREKHDQAQPGKPPTG